MRNYKRSNSYDMTEIAMFVVILILCSWISIPTVIPFTLQTFAIFLAICILGGKKTTIIVFVYLLMGCIGIPVFSGFCGGIGCLVGNTGGFLIGFLFSTVAIWGIERLTEIRPWIQWLQMITCICICYLFGVLWYLHIIQIRLSLQAIIPIVSVYVVPYIIPDIVKMCVAYIVSKRLKKVIRNISR